MQTRLSYNPSRPCVLVDISVLRVKPPIYTYDHPKGNPGRGGGEGSPSLFCHPHSWHSGKPFSLPALFSLVRSPRMIMAITKGTDGDPLTRCALLHFYFDMISS